MPNTLIHIAIQTPISRAASPKTEIPWILAGAIIPDIPWVYQRLLLAVKLVDPYQVKLYCTAQASLIFCLLLCVSVASCAKNPWRIFLILAVNSLIHLLLDTLQIKWGSGVHLLAPFDWQAMNIGLVWPENIFGYVLSFVGLVYLFINFRIINREGFNLNTAPRLFLCTLTLLLYFTAPFMVMKNLEESNFNYMRILKNQNGRIGQHIELDRAYFAKDDSRIILFSGEPLKVTGEIPDHSSIISLKGVFTAADAIESIDFHKHSSYRDNASKVGLFFVLVIWLYLLLPHFRGFTQKYRQ